MTVTTADRGPARVVTWDRQERQTRGTSRP